MMRIQRRVVHLGTLYLSMLAACQSIAASSIEEATAYQIGIPWHANHGLGVDSLIDSLTIRTATNDGTSAVGGVWLRLHAAAGTVMPALAQTDAQGLLTVEWRLPRPTSGTTHLTLCDQPTATSNCSSPAFAIQSHSAPNGP